MQIHPIRSPQPFRRGQGKIQHHQFSAGPEHSRKLSDRSRPVLHVAKSVTDGQGIEGVVRERKVHSIGHDEIPQSPLSGPVQHGGAEIGSDDERVGTGFPDCRGEVTAPGGHIQNSPGLFPGQETGHFVSPENIDSTAQDVIGKNVAVGNGRKSPVDEMRILVGGVNFGFWILDFETSETRERVAGPGLEERTLTARSTCSVASVSSGNALPKKCSREDSNLHGIATTRT